MSKVNVMGITIDDIPQSEIFNFIEQTIQQKDASYITTINSELLQLSLRNSGFKSALEHASLRVCDGIGVQWAAAFLSKKHPVFINLFRAPFSLLRLIIQPSSAQRAIRNRTAGRLLFEELLKFAEVKGYSVFFLGGGEGVAQAVSQKAKLIYPQLVISGHYAGSPEQPKAMLNSINSSNILFVAFGSPKQELFIQDYLKQLKSNLTIGLGGTFDAYVGAKPIGSAFRQIKPPTWVNRLGIESFWRLITQPNRFNRVARSTLGLVVEVIFGVHPK